jgi:DNA-binding IclR family transcriptional regulator
VRTVDRALKLLNLFSIERPEIGLSKLARLAGYDKATTRRMLLALAEHRFVEQDPHTKAYRLGAGPVRLARIREACFPLTETAIPVIRDLARQTGETVHLSEFSAGSLITLYVEPSMHANRVNVDPGQILPLHSTASGLAYLAFCGDEADQLIGVHPLTAYTSHTISDPHDLEAAVRATARRGYSIGDQGFEEGVFSVAAPILGPDGFAIGTLAVASPLGRINKEVTARHGAAVMGAAHAVSARLFGERLAGE